MTKYGHKSDFIAITRLRVWIVDKVCISKKNIQSFPYHITLLTLTIACKAKHSHLYIHYVLKVASFDTLS